MSTTATHLVPQDVLQRLVCSLAPDSVMLFGSRARASARAVSDIDLLLVGTWTMDRAYLLRHARRLVAHSFPHVDLVLCTQEEIRMAKTDGAPFLQSILEKGVLIYDRTESADTAQHRGFDAFTAGE